MKKVSVNVELGKGNFAAYIETLPGVIATGDTQKMLEKNMREAVDLHIQTSQEFGEKVPAIFKGKYELVFKYEPMALLSKYTGIFTRAALERITGINKKQISHYATGLKKPRPEQKERIINGLHELGQELLQIEL